MIGFWGSSTWDQFITFDMVRYWDSRFVYDIWYIESWEQAHKICYNLWHARVLKLQQVKFVQILWYARILRLWQLRSWSVRQENCPQDDTTSLKSVTEILFSLSVNCSYINVGVCTYPNACAIFLCSPHYIFWHRERNRNHTQLYKELYLHKD